MEALKKLVIRFRRAISFGAVGIINTGVDFAVFMLCRSFINLGLGVSQAAGYLAGVVCSFVLNRAVTFKDHTRSLPAQIAMFIFINAVSFSVSTYFIEILSGWGLHDYLAKIAVTGTTMLINYFGYKILVFKVSGNGKEKGKNE